MHSSITLSTLQQAQKPHVATLWDSTTLDDETNSFYERRT